MDFDSKNHSIYLKIKFQDILKIFIIYKKTIKNASFALVFNKNTVTIYINGTKEEITSYAPTNSNTSIPLFKKIAWQGEYLTIGALGENRGENFLGRLDDLRIYERALTKKTIRKLIRIKNREKNKYTTYSYSNEATYDEGVMKIE